MTSIIELPNDIAELIHNALIEAKDKLALRHTSILFRDSSSKMKLKIAYMTDKLNAAPKLDCMCANIRCINIPLHLNLRMPRVIPFALGETVFYYPNELFEPHDYEGDPYGPNFEFPYREQQCESGPTVTRNIPYCIDCMKKLCIYGREKRRI